MAEFELLPEVDPDSLGVEVEGIRLDSDLSWKDSKSHLRVYLEIDARCPNQESSDVLAYETYEDSLKVQLAHGKNSEIALYVREVKAEGCYITLRTSTDRLNGRSLVYDDLMEKLESSLEEKLDIFVRRYEKLKEHRKLLNEHAKALRGQPGGR